MLQERAKNVGRWVYGVGVRVGRRVIFPAAELYKMRGIVSLEGLRAYDEMMGKARRGEHFYPSDYITIFSGIPLQFQGAEQLQETEGGLLIVGNYCNMLPLEGLSTTILVNYALKNVLGREASWVVSEGKNMAKPIHSGVAESGGNILVRGKSNRYGIPEIHQRLDDGGIVALFPEGKENRAMAKAESTSGRIIGERVSKGDSVVGFAAFPTGEGYTLSFVGLDTEEIRKLYGNDRKRNRESGQEIADFVMLTIARHAPGPIRGYYR